MTMKTIRLEKPERIAYRAQWNTGTAARLSRNEELPDDGEAMVIPAVLATEAEVVHWMPGVGRARVILDLSEETVSSWNIESVSFMKDHGYSVDHIIGRMKNLRADDGRLRVDAHFDPVLGAQYYGGVERGTYTDLSISADISTLALVSPESDEELALYRATEWIPVEGSLVWKGADTQAGFMRTMNPKLESYLRANGLSDAQIAGAEEIRVEGKDSRPVKAERSVSDLNLDKLVQDTVKATTESVVRSLVPLLAKDDKKAEPMTAAATSARDKGVPEDAIARHLEIAGDDAEAFGRLNVGYLAERQEVPEIPAREARDTASGGHERRYEALADMAATLASRCGVASESDLKRISKHNLERSVPTTVLAVRAMQAWQPSKQYMGETASTLALLARETVSRNVDSIITQASVPSARYVKRDAWGGLVPGDLPSVFADVMHKSFMPSFMKHVLPFERLAIQKDVMDRRTHHMVHTDIAGRFEPLAVGENLKQMVIREYESVFNAEPYGGVINIEWASFVDDDLGILQRIPQQLAIWIAAMRTQIFTAAVNDGLLKGGQNVFVGDYDIEAPDVLDFATILQTVRARAQREIPVSPGAGEDPRNDSGRTNALVPDRMLIGNDIYLPWERFAKPTTTDRREDFRVDYETQIWNGSYEGLYVPSQTYYLWPGPDSPFCPMAYGEIRGQPLSISTGALPPEKQDGMYIRYVNTFGASLLRGTAMFRVRPQTP